MSKEETRNVRNRAVAQWSSISEVVRQARDRQEARQVLIRDFGFSDNEADVVLEMTVGDLPRLLRADSLHNGPDDDGEWDDWERRGHELTPHSWSPEERETSYRWIVEGVERGWLEVVRSREAGSLHHVGRTDRDRSIYIDHEVVDGSTIRLHTAIGGTYSIVDESLATELSDRIEVASVDVWNTAMAEGEFSLCDVRFNCQLIAGRSLKSQGWWAVAFAVGPQTNTFCTGSGTYIPELDLVTVQSFDGLQQQVEA